MFPRAWLGCILVFIPRAYAQSPADYPNNVPGTCGSPTLFDCGDGRCIPFQSVRNCVRDCANGIDEMCGSNQVLCDVQIGSGCGKCVQNATSSSDCLDRRYARLCDQGIVNQPDLPLFKCVNTPNCILIKWLNDGVNDCGDWSDEDPCLKGFTCSQKGVDERTRFTLCTCNTPYPSSGTVWTRPDPLMAAIPGNCQSNPLQFDCGNRCINISQFRDCVPDCSNGLDERCWSGTTMCSDGCTCVPPQTGNTSVPSCPAVATTLSTTRASTTAAPITTTLLTTTPTSTATTTITTTTPTTTATATTTTRPTTTAVATTTALATTPSTSPVATTSTPRTTQTTTPTATIASTTPSTTTRTTVTTTSTSTQRTTTPTRCGPNDFTCANGECISDRYVLDGTRDCSDGSDESFCGRFLNCSNCVYVLIYNNFTCGCPPLSQASGGICVPISTDLLPVDCADLAKRFNIRASGIYTVYKPNCTITDNLNCASRVRCDMDTSGGGWTLMQRRVDGSENFFRNWDDYKRGFGEPAIEFWQGNDYISALTNRPKVPYELLVLLTPATGQQLRAHYDRIAIANESQSYAVTLGKLVEGDYDDLILSRNRRFGTYDRDSGTLMNAVCGGWWQAGWWFDAMCNGTGNLNVPYNDLPQFGHLHGIQWLTAANRASNIRATTMMVRPVGYSLDPQTTLTAPVTLTPKTGKSDGSRATLVIGLLTGVAYVTIIGFHWT